jgi:dihydroflavonol-4-reductase
MTFDYGLFRLRGADNSRKHTSANKGDLTTVKYLVTGATGLLGNNIVRVLIAAGEQVRVLARASSDPRTLADLPIERAEGDVRDKVAVENACRGIDIVIHAAGYVHLGWKQLEQLQAINVEGTKTVAAAVNRAGARLIHISGVNALGLGKLANPADEDSALPGIVECGYVVTKRAAEAAVLEEVSHGLDAVIVNPGCMFGPWDWKPSSGKMLLAVAKFAPIYPTGAVTFCDARDVAAGTVAAAKQGRRGLRYILGGHNLSYLDAWRQMAQLAGRRGPISPMGPLFRAAVVPILDAYTWLRGREGDANSAVLLMGRQQHCFSSRRAETELGYLCRPFAETLADTWAWFRQWGYI